MEVLTVSANLEDVAGRLPTEKQARTVVLRAIRRGVVAGQVQAAREVAKEYAIKQAQVRRSSRVKRPSLTKLEGLIEFRGPATNVADFRVAPARPQPARRPLLRVMVGRASGLRPYRGAFLVAVRAGRILAFRRKGKGRLPIAPVYGPSIPSLVGAERVRTAVERRVREVVVTRLDHEINRELLKGARR